MKQFSIFLFSLVLISAFVFSPPEVNGQQANAAEQELITLSTQWMEALEQKNQEALERFLADEFYLSAPGELKKVHRSEWLKTALELGWSNLEYHDFKVDVHNDTAVVTSLLDFTVTTKSGIPISTNSQIMDIWVNRNGQWQVASRHTGAYSIEGYIRLIVGFVAGLGLFLGVWLLLRLKRRFAAKRKLRAI